MIKVGLRNTGRRDEMRFNNVRIGLHLRSALLIWGVGSELSLKAD